MNAASKQELRSELQMQRATDQRLARLLRNSRSSADSQVDSVALTSRRAMGLLSKELRRRGRMDLVRAVLDG